MTSTPHGTLWETIGKNVAFCSVNNWFSQPVWLFKPLVILQMDFWLNLKGILFSWEQDDPTSELVNTSDQHFYLGWNPTYLHSKTRPTLPLPVNLGARDEGLLPSIFSHSGNSLASVIFFGGAYSNSSYLHKKDSIHTLVFNPENSLFTQKPTSKFNETERLFSAFSQTVNGDTFSESHLLASRVDEGLGRISTSFNFNLLRELPIVNETTFSSSSRQETIAPVQHILNCSNFLTSTSTSTLDSGEKSSFLQLETNQNSFLSQVFRNKSRLFETIEATFGSRFSQLIQQITRSGYNDYSTSRLQQFFAPSKTLFNAGSEELRFQGQKQVGNWMESLGSSLQEGNQRVERQLKNIFEQLKGMGRQLHRNRSQIEQVDRGLHQMTQQIKKPPIITVEHKKPNDDFFWL